MEKNKFGINIMTEDTTVKMVNRHIDLWERETCNLSYHDPDHPAFILVKKIADKNRELVITTILKRMQKEITWFFIVLRDIVPLEDQIEISEDMKGKIKDITEAWLEWGYAKEYLEDN